MEKYGVEEKEEKEEKTATDTKTCPECDSEVTKHGRVKLCPNCGSEPFEDVEENEQE